MNLQTLTQKVSDTTHIGKGDVQLIMNKAFSILANNAKKQTTLTIPKCGTSPEFNLFIRRV